ncbi:MAG: Ig domain-containing protein, partial [Candidatus Falkowbacteria bacterium]|nr:Ig domain-containing protein [Candidatus Falkowbacteria bacterium]
MIKKHQLWLLGAVMLIALFLAVFKYSQAQTPSLPTDAADAIAVRIIPNPNHYSIVRWYEAQGFTGSPQALIVDGYEAIRDGRTVYVNAANVDTGSRLIYTNIYLISYNQDSTAPTVDILGQIVAHWKFNSNIVESTNPVPDCSISATACSLNTDCATDQYCATSSANIASSSCLLKKPKNCLVDTDCPNTLFCNSLKSKITRDIKRVGQLEELKEALFNFKNHNNYYPRLSSGTYLAGNSLSVWPSWTQSLLADAAVSQNFLDPINRLGVCLGYDVKTCWNSDLKKFVSNPSGTTLILPDGSYAFAYSTDANGSNYNLCAVMESRAANLNYHFSPNDPVSSACVTTTGIISGGTAENTAPRLIDQFLIGQANREFSGFLKVVDFENNPLTWSISGPAASWVSLKDTSDLSQKSVYASNAPGAGSYPLILTVSDGRGGTLATTTQITILADAPRIEAADAEYVLDPTVPFNYNFSFSSNNLNNPATAYSVVKTSGLPDVLGLGLSKTFLSSPGNNYKVNYTGIIPTANKFYQDANINYRINLTDKGGHTYPKTFKIRIIVDQPQLNFDCPVQTRANNNYTCPIGSLAQGSHTLTYAATGLPSGLSLTGATSTIISGQATSTPSDYSINIKATNEYGASTTKAFVLKVNNYCGDGAKQLPNTEGRGGIYNDGYEDCDITAGVAIAVSTSSSLQYGCRTGVGFLIPDPILTNTYCVFKSPLEGGGYCGDSYCQALINGQTMETCGNCPQDCGVCPCTPVCVGKCGGDDHCGGSCDATQSVCLSGETATCTATVAGGLPGYCTGFTAQGTKTCNTTCTGWSECTAVPTIVSNTSTGCSSTSKEMTGYGCCELISCVNDGCRCCGRPEGASTPSGYSLVKDLSPCANSACACTLNEQICECGTPDCNPAPTCVTTNKSCKLNQSISNNKNWIVTTNHTTAYYRCYGVVVQTCTDGTKNGNETGIDCGGSCPACTVAPTC